MHLIYGEQRLKAFAGNTAIKKKQTILATSMSGKTHPKKKSTKHANALSKQILRVCCPMIDTNAH
jgi:hypothetical protein